MAIISQIEENVIKLAEEILTVPGQLAHAARRNYKIIIIKKTTMLTN